LSQRGCCRNCTSDSEGAGLLHAILERCCSKLRLAIEYQKSAARHGGTHGRSARRVSAPPRVVRLEGDLPWQSGLRYGVQERVLPRHLRAESGSSGREAPRRAGTACSTVNSWIEQDIVDQPGEGIQVLHQCRPPVPSEKNTQMTRQRQTPHLCLEGGAVCVRGSDWTALSTGRILEHRLVSADAEAGAAHPALLLVTRTTRRNP
jgi:hypothetical protein